MIMLYADDNDHDDDKYSEDRCNSGDLLESSETQSPDNKGLDHSGSMMTTMMMVVMMMMMKVVIIIMDKTHSTTTNDPKDMSGKNLEIGHWGSLSISTNRKK